MNRSYAGRDFVPRSATSPFTSEDLSTQTILVYILAALFLIHQVLHQYDIIPLSISDGFWNLIVAATPAFILLNSAERRSPATWSQKHAAKAESMRKMLGLNTRGLLQQVAAPHSLLQRMSITSVKSNTPPGLGNWDNSCYQNSVLQGLASLKALRTFLDKHDEQENTMSALRETTDMLRNAQNNGKHVWTPAKLKSMSSWQQQDAQEYYSKIMDELEKDVLKAQPKSAQAGCETVLMAQRRQQDIAHTTLSNPLEGMLAQRVACTACGFTEGLSIIPFNCLTLPLENKPEINLEDCLAEYTKEESITGVECTSCTLLKTRKELQRLICQSSTPTTTQSKTASALPPALLAQVTQRLHAVKTALDSDDFSDETLSKACQITKNARVTSTKTRQALLARMPANLVLHFNRSVFDEMTGSLRKNYAAVRYPAVLDLRPWILIGNAVNRPQDVKTDLRRDDLWKYMYRIRAVVTHSGRHENGHYVAYRQAPVYDEDDIASESNQKQQWWRLSDETVTAMTESAVLDEGGVFMLFYERFEDDDVPTITNSPSTAVPDAAANGVDEEVDQVTLQPAETTATPLNDTRYTTLRRNIDRPISVTDADTVASDTSFMDQSMPTHQAPVPEVRKSSPPSPLLMRTANVERNNDEHWTMGRFVAAS